MLSYHEWLGEGKVNMYELYLLGPGVNPIAEKVMNTVKGVVINPKSYMVIKFRGTKKDLTKVEKALQEAGFRVVDSEIEHD